MRPWLISLALCVAFVAVAQEPAGDAQSDWNFIERLRSDGMNDVAARELVRFARNHPEDARAPQALMEAAQLFESLEQTVMALGAYDLLLRDHPSSEPAPAALLRKGTILSEAGRFGEAVNVYRGMLNSFAAHPGAEEARLGLGEAQMALGETEEAQRHFRYLIGGRAQASVAARASFDLGLLHLRADEDSLAILQFDQIPERYPKQAVGAFALLRSGDLWRGRGEISQARARYESVLSRYEEPFLQARARLALGGLAREEGDPRAAVAHYRAVGEGSASREQLEAALIGLSEAALEAGQGNEAQRAASVYLERYPDGQSTEQARLLRARGDRLRGESSAADSLMALASSRDLVVQREAWLELATMAQEAGDASRALERWRRAGWLARSGDEAAEALLAQSRIAASDLARPALASELAEEASDRAESDEVAARALWLALQSARDGGDRARAMALAGRLVDDHPLSEQASLAELTRRQLGEAAQQDPATAAAELSALALRNDLTPYEHALLAGRIVRDRWGESLRAAELFARAGELAAAPPQRALAELEAGLCHERHALARALDGDEDAARRALAQARRIYADAAAIAGAGDAAGEALLGLLRLETALVAAPDEPWFFDARYSPLLGAVGVAEAHNAAGAEGDALRRRLAQAIAQGDAAAAAKPWLQWRAVELSHDEVGERLAAIGNALAACRDPRLSASLKLTRAQLELQAQEAERAAATLRQVLAEGSGETALAARYLLAELHREARGYAAASQLYAEFAGALPNTQKGQRSLLLAGDCEFHLGHVEDADARYRELLERAPDSVYEDDATYRHGTALLRLGRISQAQAAFQSLIDWPEGSDYAGRALWKLAELRERAGDRDLARQNLRDLLSVDPGLAKSEDALLRLARLCVDDGDPDAAIRWIDRRDAEREADAASLALRVEAHARAGNADAAERRLQELELGFPQERQAAVAARLELAEALDRQQKSERALEQFQRALDNAPAELRSRATYGMGLAQLRLSRFDDATKSLQRVRSSDPSSEWGAQALFKLGQIYQRAQQDQAAQEAYAELVARHPDHELAPQALRGEARAWRDLGRYDEALERYHRLLEEHNDLPDGASILAQIAYCHHEMGKHELAIAAYRRVMPELDEEERGYAQFWVADSFEQLGRYEDAAAEFLRIPYLYPKLGQLAVTAQLKAGGAYERMGERDAARRLYEKVLSAHGAESTWGAEAQKRLDRLAATPEES